MTKHKTATRGGTLTVAVGGWYVADHEMAAKLGRGDKPRYEDVKAASKRCEPGDQLNANDLPEWTLRQMHAGGFFVEDGASEGEAAEAPPADDLAMDTSTEGAGEPGAPEWPWSEEEGVNSADV